MVTLINLNDMITAKVPITSYPNDDLLQSLVFLIQEQKLKALIGKDLYNELIASYPTYTGLNAQLMALIKPYLAWHTFVKYCYTGGFTSTQSGVRSHLENYSEPLTAKAMNEYTAPFIDLARVFENSILLFLKDNDLLSDCTIISGVATITLVQKEPIPFKRK